MADDLGLSETDARRMCAPFAASAGRRMMPPLPTDMTPSARHRAAPMAGRLEAGGPRGAPLRAMAQPPGGESFSIT
jgi:hypothetical protein